MLYPERMKQVKIIVHNDYANKLISKVHESGYIEITENTQPKDNEEFQDKLRNCKQSIVKTEKYLEIIEKVEEKEKTLIQEIMNPTIIEKQKTDFRDLDQILEESSEIFTKIDDKIISSNSKLNKIDEEISLLSQQKDKVGKIKHDFDLSLIGESDYLIIKAGTTESLFELNKAIEEHPIKIFFNEIDKNYYSVVIIAHKDQQEIFDHIVRANLFNEIEVLDFKGYPNEIINEIEEKKKQLEEEKEQTTKNLQNIGKEWKDRLLVLNEELKIEEERKEALTNFERTGITTIIDGFVKSKNAEKLENLCDEVTNHYYSCIFSEPEGNNAPIILNNPGWARPFESLINTFSPPKYNEIESTVILAPIFVIFFGLMLGDAGYGLIILILSIFGFVKHGKVSPTIKDFAYIGILLGVSTIFFGVLMGSFFGDLIPRYFYSYDTNIPTIYNISVNLPLLGETDFPYDPIGQPIPMLVISLLIGISALSLGIILAGVHNLKYNNYKEFMTHQVSWYLLIPSGGALIGHGLLNIWTLNGTVFLIFGLMAGIGLVLLLMANGALFFFEITGFIGDWLSYVRILALGLATAGIAMTVNIMGEVAIEMHQILIIGAFFVLIIGHLVNLAFQGLGAGVHTLRLQYVEFFGRFYEGGGKLFKAFKAERVYTELDEN